MSDRTLEDRLTEYRNILLGMADDLHSLLRRIPPPASETQAEARAGLQAAVDIYRIIAGEDLTKLLAGEELNSFVIVGEIPRG
jgi:hypothetical protein